MIKNEREKFKRFDPALVERAMELAEDIGPIRAAAVLGLTSDRIRSWLRRKAIGRYMKKGDSPEMQELIQARTELQKLRRENGDLKKANVVLKKLASFFSKDHPPTDSEWSVKSSVKKVEK